MTNIYYFMLQFCAEFVQKNLFQRVTNDMKSSQYEDTSLHVDTYKNILTKELLNLDGELLQASKEISDISGKNYISLIVSMIRQEFKLPKQLRNLDLSH